MKWDDLVKKMLKIPGKTEKITENKLELSLI